MSDNKPGRLPSLRGPRDLTLGGVKKKTFAPKIPVRKERNKKEQGASEAQPAKKDVAKRGRSSRGRGRGRGRGRPEVIQSHSIFEAGPSAEAIGKRGGDRGFTSAGGGSTKEAIQKPTLRHEIVDEDFEKAKTAEALKNLEGTSRFLEDLESDESLLPTCLPMGLSTWPPALASSKSMPGDKKSNMNCAEILEECISKQEDCQKIIVFQLPDSLPAIPPTTEAELKKEANVKSETNIKHEPSSGEGDGRCSFDQLSEGYVGKLQIMKSGRSRLVMGGIVLDLHAGTPSSFLEELTSIDIPTNDPDVNQGTISVLGNLSHKIICSPDMESLIRQCKVT